MCSLNIMSREFKNPSVKTAYDYFIITVSVLICVVGVYFFKFPNHFAFGGITGLAAVLPEIIPVSAGAITLIANVVLLLVGFLFLGRSFGFKTVYASLLMSFSLEFLERVMPMSAPLTDEPLLELVFAVLLPAVGSALMFNIGATAGGVDILAMILKKYTGANMGTLQLYLDIIPITLAFIVFGPQTGLYSCLGLIAKSALVNGVIDSLNMCKCFNIVCDDPDPICDYIINVLKRDATVYEAQGAYSHSHKAVILTTMRRSQALHLRNYISEVEPHAFMLISNSSEIVGKGFLAS